MPKAASTWNLKTLSEYTIKEEVATASCPWLMRAEATIPDEDWTLR